ncbi:MAG: D-sedoheptulose 7-phosphate isomerase [Gammaproteobacteria bacterium]|jgi:D-sedoheptulose 7-phosphate isomerase|nr:D-sedoheptulose 7-phosphate isomerase [Gammaproteobacteria bacterium]
MNQAIAKALTEHAGLLSAVEKMAPEIERAAARIVDCLRHGNTVYWCGNGGSAADAQHFAAELIGRFERERRAMASVALTADTSVLTSIGNDYGFADVFRRQVEGLVRKGDVLVGISTSGSSANVLRAVDQARAQGGIVIGLLGRDGGTIAPLCDLALVVPGSNTARIQEMHALIGHLLCELVEVNGV